MNESIRLLGRFAIRRRWRGIVAVALLGGISGAVVLTAAAGARRTSAALRRFEAFSRSADVEVAVGDASPEQLREFQASSGVAAIGRLRQIALALPNNEFLPTAAAYDDRFGTVVDRARVVRGRLPDNSAADELAIGEALASRLRVDVGSTLTFDSYTPAQTKNATAGNDPGGPQGPRIRLRVVGVVRRPLDLAARGEVGGVIVPTPAFLERYSGEVGSFAGDILRVRTRNGARDVPRVIVTARRIFGRSPSFGVQGLGVETEGAQDAIDVLTFALWIFAATAGLAGAVFVAIVGSRVIASDRAEQPVLAALGLTRFQRTVAVAAPAIPTAIAAAAVALAGAVLFSPLLPFGIARHADPDPGVHADWLVIGPGVLAVVVFFAAIGAFSASRVARSATTAGQREFNRGDRSLVAALAGRSGLSPAGIAGIGFALEPGRGPRAIPVRSAIAGAVIGALGMTAVLVFASSFGRLESTSTLYGWSFDAVLLANDAAQLRTSSSVCGDVDSPVVRDPAFSAVASVCTLNTEISGRPVTAWSFAPLRGSIQPEIVGGRAPTAIGEIALGASTLRALHKHIGDHVTVAGARGSESYVVVGQVVLPSPASMDPQPLADGAAITGAALNRLGGARDQQGNADFHLVVRLAPGVSLASARHDSLGLAQFDTGKAQGPAVPVEIERIRRVRQLPFILAGFLAILAAIAIAHALLTTARRRRHDLAVLRALGFTRRQVRATVAWQATTLGIVGLLIGIPVGGLVGRVVWRRVADGLGVSGTAIFAPLAVLFIAIAALALVNLIGAVAAAGAVRQSPATALATE